MNTQHDHASGVTTRSPGGLGPRVGARLVDAVLLTVLGVGLGISGLGFGFGWLAIVATLTLAYFVVLDVTAGTTVGKRLLRLSVTGPDGGRPTVGQALRRELFTLVGAIPYAGGPLSLVTWIALAVSVNASPTRQGLHDRLAGGTRVTAA